MTQVNLQINRIFIVLPMICLFLLSISACGIDLPKASVTVKVVNENGLAMSGENVELGFTVPKVSEQGIKSTILTGATDSNGIYTATSRTIGDVGYSVKKEGWYESYGQYRFKNKESGKWQPWNHEIKVVMRKKENPVPMYAQNLIMTHPNIEIPTVGKPVGFDLIEYDWVSPYGKGKHADFIFKLERKFVSDNDFDATLMITFPNKFDGIQLIKDDRKGGSVFKLPRYAPEEGYQSKLTRFMRGKGGGIIERDYKEENNFIFRVRSEVKDGKLIKAMYGKIQGEIELEPRGSKTAVLLFKYFLNPNYTRNLEYGKNLFPGVQVGIEY